MTELPRILEDAQDIAVAGRAGDNYIFAAKPSLDFQRDAYKKSLVDTEVPEFQGHWQFNEQRGITGSSTYITLRFDQHVFGKIQS